MVGSHNFSAAALGRVTSQRGARAGSDATVYAANYETSVLLVDGVRGQTLTSANCPVPFVINAPPLKEPFLDNGGMFGS
jgi:hypothetical protein